jgi:hypothetical protein
MHNLMWFLIWEFTNIVTEKVIYSEFSVGCGLVPNAVKNIYCAINVTNYAEFNKVCI